MERLTNFQGLLIKCIDCKDNDDCYNSNCSHIDDSLKLLKQYEDIGLTPDELRKLKDKNTAYHPILEGDGYDSEGNLVLDEWLCPNCNTRYEVDYDMYDFCPSCGQRIKWDGKEE